MRKVSSLVTQIILFLVAVILIFGVSYIIGFPYLNGSHLQGNDTNAFFAITQWVSRYYPKLYFWFPLQGSGVSFDGYPWFSVLIVNFIAYYSKLDLVQSFRLVGFLSVPLTGFGIFIFCWTRLTSIKEIWYRQILGIIAGLFSVIAPASWIWLAQWGFYADQISVIFVPFILIFFDLFIDRLFSKNYDFYFRLGILGTLIFWLLGFLTHFFIGVGTITIFLMIIILRVMLQRENKIELLKRLIVPLGLFFVCLVGVVSFRYYSYSSYSNNASEGGFTGLGNPIVDRQGTKDRLQTPAILLSLKNPIEDGPNIEMRSTIKDMRFQFYVWLLVLPTLLFGIFKSKKMFVFALFTLIGFIANTNIDFYIFLQNVPIIKSIPIISNIPTTFMGRLFFAQARVLTPIASAFGLFILWELVIFKFSNRINKILKPILMTVFTITVLSVVVFKFYNMPYDKTIINTGYYKVDLRDIWNRSITPIALIKNQYSQKEWEYLTKNPSYSNMANYNYLASSCVDHRSNVPVCDYYNNSPKNKFPPMDVMIKAQKDCASKSYDEFAGDFYYCRAMYFNLADQLMFKKWRPFLISSDMSEDLKGLESLFVDLPKDKPYRYDISGFAGKTLQATSLVNEGSQMQIYMGTLSLIFNQWNYQAQMMYSSYPIYQKPDVLTEIGKWWGLDYVYLTGTPLEPHDFWNADSNWEKQNPDTDKGWRKFTKSTGEETWDNRPKILVISDNAKFFYDNTFKFFTRGGLLYEQGIPVHGTKYVDDYSLDQLKNYEIVFMRSYGYKNKSYAYNLLNDYVEQGGKLIFDTGWQYNIPDYEIDKAPEFMPFDNLVWKNLDTNAKLEVNDEDLAGKIDASKMGDLKYEETHSWGVSSPTKVRSWGKVLVSAQNAPLAITGDYGKGKVLWFGFNLLPHSETKDSMEEVKLFNVLTLQLLGDKNISQYDLESRRINPDKIEFVLNDSSDTPSNLFFRESYYPDWKAKLISVNSQSTLTIDKAGPGFMLINLPKVKNGDRVVLTIEKSFGQKVANTVSIATFMILLVYLFFPKPFGIIGSKVGKQKVHIPKPQIKTKNEDEEY